MATNNFADEKDFIEISFLDQYKDRSFAENNNISYHDN